MEGGLQSANVSSGKNLLRIISASELAENEKRLEAESQRQAEPQVSGLVALIENAFSDNKKDREESGVEEKMLDNLRQRDGAYDATKLAAIQAKGGSEMFVKITNVKCRAAEAWISDVLSNGMDKPWSLDPTPSSDLPEEVEQAIMNLTLRQWMQEFPTQEMNPSDTFIFASKLRDRVQEALQEEAKTRAKRMENKIEDQLAEGDWVAAFDDFITDVVTLKCGYIKGPIIRNEKKLVWKKVNGKMTPEVKTEKRLCFERLSPFDAYPAGSSSSPQEGNFIERVRFFRKSLLDMKGLDGWNSEAIDLVLKEYGEGGLREWSNIDDERAQIEQRGTATLACKDAITGLEFWGSVAGRHLIDQNITKDLDGKLIDPMSEYEINAIKIGNYIVYADFNPDLLLERPYTKSGYDKIPGSYYFKGVPELMDDLQTICNASVRSLVNNMGVASGMQAVVEDINRLCPGENLSAIEPMKVWQFINPRNSTLPAVTFFQPQSNANELMGVYDKFSMLADDYTGIPAYAYGNDRVAGAGRTKGGLEMLMNSSARGIKKVISRIDAQVMNPILTRLYNYNMRFDPDESIKGDAKIVPVGVLGLIVKEQAAEGTTQFLQTTANPVDFSIMKKSGRAFVLREGAKRLNLPVDKIVPSEEKMQQEDKIEAEMAARSKQEGGPVEQPQVSMAG